MVEEEEKRTTVAKKQVKQFYFTHHSSFAFLEHSGGSQVQVHVEEEEPSLDTEDEWDMDS